MRVSFAIVLFSGVLAFPLSGTALSGSTITSPTSPSTLTSASTTFTWNAGPAGTTGYGLNVGTTGVGSANLVNIGPLSGTSVTVSLPTNGTKIYVRLWTELSGPTYLSNDYTYTEFTQSAAAIISPTPGTTLTSASTTFTWNPGPAGTTGYGLNVGTTGVGSADLVNIGPLSGTSVTVNLPTNGTTIYVRLWTELSGPTYLSNDYTYTEFTVGGGTKPGDAITWRYDNSLDGLNASETTLTTANVNSTTFGKVGEFSVDGRIDGQVLYLGQISISGTMKNVIYFATENDTVYAVDADSISGTTATVLWSKSLVPSGEAPATDQQTGGACGNVSPTGVEGTPVIDRGRNAIYAVAKTMSSTTNTTQYFRIHALDLTNGNELFGGPTTISATYPGTGGNASGGVVTFSPREQSNRPGLLETGGNIYVAFGGQDGDCGLYSGWLISYSADTLAQGDAIDLNPNSAQGGMWNSGASPSADAGGSVYVATANTGDDNSIGPNDYPISVVRLTNSGTLAVADYFTPYNAETLDKDDLDMGSAGVLILPDLMDSESVVHQYAVAAGKDGNMYVLNRDNMGQYHMSTNDSVQTIAINGASGTENFSTPAYFNNNVYVCPSGQTLKAFSISNAQLATSATMSTTTAIGTSGFTISANGTSNGIVWAIQPTNGHGVLYAFNASSLSTMLYASNQATGNRDQTAQIEGNFHTPTVANGKVYFGTGTTVAVFGLLP